MQTAGFGFFQSLFVAPMVVGNAVGRDHGASAILAFAAVNKDGSLAGGIQYRHQPGNLLAGGGVEAFHGYVDVVQTGRFGGLPLGIRVGTAVAKVEDCFDTQFRQIPESFVRRLGSSIKILINLMEVRYAD